MVPAARQFAPPPPLPPPPPSWQLEDHRLPLGSRTINPAARRTITREYVYYASVRPPLLFRLSLGARAKLPARAGIALFFPHRCNASPSSPLPCFRPGCSPLLLVVVIVVIVIGNLLPVFASRIPRTLLLKPTVYNDRLLIVQGQRQYINGPRIKWQQRGVVEHNPS